MNVLSPTQQAQAVLDARQASFAAQHTARLAGIAREIGGDPVRLASTLRNAPSGLLIAFCEQLIRERGKREDDQDDSVTLALSVIALDAARDEA